MDTWKLGDRTLSSRIIVGTGKYKSLGKLPVGNYQFENGWAAVGWEMPGRNVAERKITVAK